MGMGLIKGTKANVAAQHATRARAEGHTVLLYRQDVGATSSGSAVQSPELRRWSRRSSGAAGCCSRWHSTRSSRATAAFCCSSGLRL